MINEYSKTKTFHVLDSKVIISLPMSWARGTTRKPLS